MINLSKAKIRYGKYELEVEGHENFVTSEIEKFVRTATGLETAKEAALKKGDGASLLPLDASHPITAIPHPPLGTTLTPDPGNEILWKRLMEPHGRHRGLWHLRYAVKRDKDSAGQAALALLTAHKAMERKQEMTALELMRSLKASGFNPSRLDTHLKPLIERGLITASGSRRARRYEITGQGANESLRLAYDLYPALVS